MAASCSGDSSVAKGLPWSSYAYRSTSPTPCDARVNASAHSLSGISRNAPTRSPSESTSALSTRSGPAPAAEARAASGESQRVPSTLPCETRS